MQDELDEKYVRYMRCSLLNVIQHIDIYGKFQSSYAEPRRSRRAPPISVAISSCPRLASLESLKSLNGRSKTSLESRLRKMSTTTKTSSLYPGHDILSRRKRYKQGKEFVSNAVVPRH